MPFVVTVEVPEPSSPSSHGATGAVLEGVAFGAGLIGAIAGTTYCAYECKSPWNAAVPIAAGGVALTAIVVGAILYARSVAVR